MLYEINALPWVYEPASGTFSRPDLAPAPAGRKPVFVLRRGSDDRRAPAATGPVLSLLTFMGGFASILLAVQYKNVRATGGVDAWAGPPLDRDRDRASNCCDAFSIAPPAGVAVPAPPVASPP